MLRRKNENFMSQILLMNKWWNEIDLDRTLEVNKRIFVKYFMKEGVMREGRDFEELYSIIGIPTPDEREGVKLNEYNMMIMMPILTGALENIYEVISNTNEITKCLPFSARVMRYQRHMLIKGLNLQST